MGQGIGLNCFSTPKIDEQHISLIQNKTGPTNVNSKQYQCAQQELIQYKQKCNQLEKQNKELIQQLNQFTSYQKLKTFHQNWDYTKICKWIIELDNGIFYPYKDILFKNLKTEEISGKDLCQLDLNDLHRLGISNTMHKKKLLKHIKTVTQYDKTPIYNYDSHLPHLIKTPLSSLRRVSTHLSQIDFSDIVNVTNSSSNQTNSDEISAEQWNYNNGVLFIKVIKTINMSGISNGHKCNTYVELELKGDYCQKERTKIISNNKNDTIWNEKFQLFSDDAKNDILNITIWNKRKWMFYENIGNVCIPIMDVLKCDGFIDKEYDVKSSKYGGKLHIELKYKELLN